MTTEKQDKINAELVAIEREKARKKAQEAKDKLKKKKKKKKTTRKNNVTLKPANRLTKSLPSRTPAVVNQQRLKQVQTYSSLMT